MIVSGTGDASRVFKHESGAHKTASGTSFAQIASEAKAEQAEAFQNQLAAAAAERRASANAQRLMLWQSALQSAREALPREQKSMWDIIFENRAENHKLAMALAEKARAAALDNPVVF